GGTGLQTPTHLAAGQIRQLDVEHDQIGMRVGETKAFGRRARRSHGEAGGAERGREEAPHACVVVDDQNARHLAIRHNPFTIRGLPQSAPLRRHTPIYGRSPMTRLLALALVLAAASPPSRTSQAIRRIRVTRWATSSSRAARSSR